MTRTQIHIHINHFGETRPEIFNILEEEMNFSVTKVKIRENNGGWGPLWLVTNKYPESSETDELYNRIKKLLKVDSLFYGYIEKELIVEGSIAHFTNKKFNGETFADCKLPFSETERGADIHVFRDKNSPYDQLDKQLENIGFYEVVTSVHRIWTILFNDAGEAKELYEKLLKFSEDNGGVLKIENEIVQEIEPFPASFKLMPVVTM